MAANERFDETVSGWLQAEAPARLPRRVLEATFERTRGSRQQIGWRGLLGRSRMASFTPVLGAVALVVVAAVALRLHAERSAVSGPVATPDARIAFLGTWINTGDADGGTQVMTVDTRQDGAVEIVVTDTIASVCTGMPSTMSGTGRVEGRTRLVIPTPDYTCDDGREPEALSGPPLAEQLRDLTFVLDARSETLTDSFGGVWLREVGAAPSPAPQAASPTWPQSSLEEARQAQMLADAGDTRYTWQVSPDDWHQPGQHHPMSATFFARFLEQELGWEAYRWDEAFGHRAGLGAGDVIYVRCAPDGTNLLYPGDLTDACGPTLDDLRYETVRIRVVQPVREGESGIWVVTGWEMIEPAAQVVPPTDAEITALLDAFVQARIDGTGAGASVAVARDDPITDERVDQSVPLMYATSTGAPYERGEFEVVDGPVWPEGQMQLRIRLFARNDDTVVDQLFALERDDAGRVRLVYDFSLDTPSTTENGRAVPVEYSFLDGALTYRAADPLAPSQDGYRDRDRLAIDGLLPDDGAPRRVLVFLADPRPIGPDCVAGPAPADAEALARSIASDPDFEASTPAAVTIGGMPALQLDVVLAPGASTCPWSEPMISGTNPQLLAHAPFMGVDRARLWLLDLPTGSARVLAIAMITDHDSFQTVLAYAAPVVNSIELHAR